MKKVAKTISLILVLTLFAVMAIGCDSGSSGANDIKTPSIVTSGGQDAASKPAESAVAHSSSSSDQEITIDEAVLFDQGGIRITAKSFNANGTLGPEVKLLIENDSEKSITVQSRNISVNGYMVESMMSADVASGKKANDTLTLMRSDLETAGITTISDIEFSFHIFDSETWDTIVDSEMVRIETSAAEGFIYSFDDSGNQVYNENGVEIVVKGLSESGSWIGPAVVVYIYNSGDRDFTVQARDVSINGFMVDTLFSSDVVAGKHAMDTITFMSSELEENGIETIESVELSFHVFDMSSWDTIVDTAPVTISFN